MKITVVYNQVESLTVGRPEDILADEDTVKTAKAIVAALTSLGHETELFEINEKNAGELKNRKTDFFFNCAFGIGSTPKSEAEVADILERTHKPYSGSNSKAIILTTDKTATKDILLAANLPTPRWQTICGGQKLNRKLNFPLIVKPNSEDASLGISDASVVSTPKQLSAQAKEMCKIYDESVLIEEFIEGRELNAAVLGNGDSAEALPISEIVFGKCFDGKCKVVDFDSKWQESSEKFRDTTGICPAKLSEKVRKEVERVALEAYKLTGCADYARVDIRLSKDNIPYILEVNANPAIGPGDGAVRSAKAAGYSYTEFLQKIIDVALARYA